MTILHLITGFLGSGKSCTIIHLLDHAPGRNGLVVADMAELNVDENLINDARARGIVAEAVCGTGNDIAALVEVISKSLEQNLYKLFVETSGVTQASRLLEAICADEGLRGKLSFGRNITVVDAGAFRYHHKEFTEQVESQLAVSDIIAINKRDLLSSEECDKLIEDIQKMAPEAYVVTAYQGQIPAIMLDSQPNEKPRFLSRTNLECKPLDSLVYRTDKSVCKLLLFGHKLLNLPFSIVRIKGDLVDDEGGHLINAVPGQLDWLPTERPIKKTALVLIGRFDPEAVRKEVDALYLEQTWT